jgi:cell division protein FtsQ
MDSQGAVMHAALLTDNQQTRGALVAGMGFFIVVCLLLGVSAAKLKTWLTDANQLPMTGLVIQGEHRYVDRDELRQALGRIPEVGNFFTLDVNQVQRLLQGLPWVHRVSVRKQWPDRLKIYIEEQQPQALWNESELLNVDGEVFSAPLERLQHSLVRLKGPQDQHQLVLETYRNINGLLKINGYQVSELEMSVRQAWRVRLADGLEVRLGRENLLQRIQRMIDLLPVIRDQDERSIAYLDLRYDTGLAVGWKDPKQDATQQEMITQRTTRR